MDDNRTDKPQVATDLDEQALDEASGGIIAVQPASAPGIIAVHPATAPGIIAVTPAPRG